MSDQQPPTRHADSEQGHDAILRLLDRPLDENDVRAATERVAQPLVPPGRNVDSLLVMRVGSELLALPAVDVARVTYVAAVRRIPHRTGAVIRGLCHVDGELLIRQRTRADLAGRVGLLSVGPSETRFSDVVMDREQPRNWEKSVAQEIFVDDPYMQGWASPRRAWVELPKSVPTVQHGVTSLALLLPRPASTGLPAQLQTRYQSVLREVEKAQSLIS